MLAEHRSRGFDFFLLTQHPSNINVFVRKLIGAPGWHQHLKRVAGASPVSRFLQWDAVNEKCEQNGSGKSASISTRIQPKEVYGWYDSAELHTGKVRIPRQVFVIVACVVGIVVLGFMTVHYLNRMGDKNGQKAAATVPGLGIPGMGPGRTGGDSKAPMLPSEYVATYTPRIPSLMHTAPAYDDLTKPKRVPVPAACVTMPSKGCKCFTQDGTPYPTDAAMCLSIVKHGIFLAFSAEPERDAAQSAPQQRPVHSERVTSAEAGPSVTLIGDGRPVAAPVPVETAPAGPQRIASVRR